MIGDSILYSRNVEAAFTQNAEYLKLVGRNSIILNPDKLKFAQKTVDWTRVRITKDAVEPLPEHIEAIKT